MSTEKKIILISGSSSGLGLAMAIKLSNMGHCVYAGTRNANKLKKIFKKDGLTADNLKVVSLDVVSDKSVNSLVNKILKREGRIDVLINNAGYGIVGALENIKTSQIQDVLDVNLIGVARCIRSVLPSMRKRRDGNIINISSVSGIIGSPFLAAYCASKAGLEGLTESLVLETMKYNIKISLVEPGLFKSNFIKNSEIENSKLNNAYFEDVDHYVNSINELYKTEKVQEVKEVADSIIKNIIFSNHNDIRFQTNKWSRKMVRAKLGSNSVIIKK